MDQPKSETPTLDIGDTPVPSGSSGSLMEEPDNEAPPAADNKIPSSSDSGLEDEGKSDSDPEMQSLSDNSSETSMVHPGTEMEPEPTSERATFDPNDAEPVTGNTNPAPSNTLPFWEGIDRTVALHVINHLTRADTDLHLGYLSQAFEQGSSAMYRFFCDLIGVDHSHIEDTRTVKRPIFNLLALSVCLPPTLCFHLLMYNAVKEYKAP
jgi:hypothetical protein